jgi:hypothetical protein
LITFYILCWINDLRLIFVRHGGNFFVGFFGHRGRGWRGWPRSRLGRVLLENAKTEAQGYKQSQVT